MFLDIQTKMILLLLSLCITYNNSTIKMTGITDMELLGSLACLHVFNCMIASFTNKNEFLLLVILMY